MPFAIYRHEKIKTAGALAASANHMTRAVPTPNADPRRAQMNRVFIGSDDPAADAAALIPALDAVDDAGKKRRRSNSVIAIEVLLTASPEWWADASAEQQQDWLDRSTAWLVQEYGRENIAHLRLHGDERTPHLTGYVVPLDPDTGHLNARRWIEARPAADSSRPTTPPPWRLLAYLAGSRAAQPRTSGCVATTPRSPRPWLRLRLRCRRASC